MSRLIVSGCSYTFHLPPTWPMFLAKKFDETYTFAFPGAGNEYIFNSIIDADSNLKFNENDTIIIEWSGPYRLDHFSEDEAGVRWITKGDLAHRPIDEFTMLNSYFPERGLLKKTVNYMLAVYRYLKEKKVNFIFTSLYNLKNSEYDDLLEEMYQDCFVMPQGMHQYFMKNFVETNLNKKGWGHPDFLVHYAFAQEFANKLNIDLDPEPKLQHFLDLVGTEENYSSNIKDIGTHPLYRYAITGSQTANPEPHPYKNKLSHQSWPLYQKILQDVLSR